MSDIVTDYKNGIYNADSGYEGGGVASIYIIRDEGRTAIVDTASRAALEPVTRAMRDMGAESGSVDYIFLTHVHLDHSGGAGAFVKEFPNARVVVHKRGARHVIDPEKLVRGAAEIYGAKTFDRLYGKVLPVPEDLVVTAGDGDEFRVGNRTIVCMDTPGHALHHLAFLDARTNGVFTGDAFGMSYLELRNQSGTGVMLTTSPVQFDPEAMEASMRRIESLEPEYLYLTHFGRAARADIASSLYRQLERYTELAGSVNGDLEEIRAGLKDIYAAERELQDCPCFTDSSCRVMRVAMELNAQGLALWYGKTLKNK
ncbi:MAG: MBL fold metallo-hydrolase [Synergistaceae bacterium]|jgi:glyoxylase-like metal-dependent hydrolase (beta-lactamase superfamily II)|nr:MBL fold metallo-hydrolase [Synergistaceae bacterium]